VPREESFVFTQVMKARGKIRELLRVAMFQPQVAATCNRENEATVETEQRRGVAFGFLVLSIPGPPTVLLFLSFGYSNHSFLLPVAAVPPEPKVQDINPDVMGQAICKDRNSLVPSSLLPISFLSSVVAPPY
jgi:hypothetical protein